MTITRDRNAGAEVRTPEIRPSRLRRVQADLGHPLLRNGHLLTLSSTITAVVGLGYWAVAARLYEESAVGANSLAISLMTLAASISQLNLASAMVRFVPAAGSATRRLVGAAYLVSAGLAMVVGTGFVVVLRSSWPGQHLPDDLRFGIVFVAAIVLYTLFVVQDGVLVGLRRAAIVPIENLFFAAAKLGLVVLLASLLPRWGIFASWAAALAGVVIAMTVYLFGVGIPRHDDTAPALPPVRKIATFVAIDYLGAICSMGAVTLLPIIVTRVLGPAPNAFFSIAWVIAYAIHLFGVNMGMSLVAETAKSPALFDVSIRRVLSHTFSVLVPGVAVLALMAPWLLAVFGDDYRSGVGALRILLLAAVPNLVVTLAISSARSQGKLRLLAAVQAAQFALVALWTVPLVRGFGINGAALSWLIAQSLLAAGLLVRRDLWFSRRPDQSKTEPAPSRAELRVAGLVAAILGLLNRSGFRPLFDKASARVRSALSGPGRADPRSRPILPELITRLPEFADVRHAQRIPTVTDVAVTVLIASGGRATGVMKASRRRRGIGELGRGQQVLTALSADPRLKGWHIARPAILASSHSDDSALVIESHLAGADLSQLLGESPGRVDQLAGTALRAIGGLHVRTGEVTEIREAQFEEWIGGQLAGLRAACQLLSPELVGAVDRADRVLRTELIGRHALVSWTHGDFAPGNVRMTAGGADVGGIIDWGGARPDRLAIVDSCFLALCISTVLERRELGDLVARRLRAGGLSDGERRWLGEYHRFCAEAGFDCASELSEVSVVLITWLDHITESWRKCDTYRRNIVWWMTNVVPVLKVFRENSFPAALPRAARVAERTPRTEAAVLSVAVVICVFAEDRWSQIADAVHSVRRQTRRAHQIIVVVDHNDALYARCASAFPGVLLVANAYGRGLSGARNIGVDAACCDIVAFLDEDAVAAPGWLEALVSAYTDDRVLGVVCRVEPLWREGRPHWFPPEFDWVVGCSYRGLPTSRSIVRNVIGANMSLRRHCLVESGGFNTGLGRDGSLPIGCEETELCIRIRFANLGGVLLYEPAARVWYRVPPARRTRKYFAKRCYSEGVAQAAVTKVVSRPGARSAETAYLTSGIPRALGRYLAGALRGSGRAWGGAAAVLVGVGFITIGYAHGRLRSVVGAARSALRRMPRTPLDVLPPLALCIAVLLWSYSLTRVRIDLIGDYGLVPLLPLTYWAGAGMLLISLAALVWRGARRPWLQAGHVIALIAMLHATPSLLYENLRYSWAWKHLGIIDFFMRHDGVDASIKELSAYQRWPAFFTLNATLDQAAGLRSSLGYAPWAPFFFGVLMLGPVLLIFRALSSDPRLIWTGLTIYVLGNWVGQDYFAPQPVAFFLYLNIIAICLTYLRPRPRGAERRIPGRRRWPYLMVAGTLIAAIAPTHQLTPLMLVAALSMLIVCRYRVVPLLVGAIALTLAWDLLFAWPWIAQNFQSITSSVGSGGSNARSGFVNLATVSESQRVIARVDRALSAAIGALAVVGFVRQFRHERDLTPAVLAVAPVPVMFSNDYGGEMIFRVFLFALPFLALYAGAAFFPRSGAGRGRSTVVTLTGLLLALFPGFIVAYFGKESANYFSRDEFAVSAYVFGTAPRGSLIVGATSDFPWAYMNYEFYDYMRFGVFEPADRVAIMRDPVGRFSDMMGGYHHSYLVITRSQIAQVEMLGALPPGGIQQIVEALMASPRFLVIFRSSAGMVITLTHPQPEVWT